MAAGHHTDAWFERQNKLTGQPRGARHSDQWYRTHQTAAAPPPPPAPPGQWLPGQGPPAANAQHDYEAFMRSAQQLSPNFDISFEQYQAALAQGGLTGLTGYQMAGMSTAQFTQFFNQVQTAYGVVDAQERAKAKAEQDKAEADKAKAEQDKAEADKAKAEQDKAEADKAAAEALAQQQMAARRDGWDRANNQGAYDADGWQSIGYQPDPIAMPDWWRDAVATPPAAPAMGGVLKGTKSPGTELGPITHWASPKTNPELYGNHPPITNALQQALAPTAPPAGQGEWGAWGQAPNFNSAPAMTQEAQPWKQPTRQTKAVTPWGAGWGASPGPGAMDGQRDPSKYGQAWGSGGRPKRRSGVWGQQPAGTWGSGSL